jgi:uncharacterized protein (TIGR02145 family)
MRTSSNLYEVQEETEIQEETSFAQKRIAILGTEDGGEPPLEITELNYLTGRLREIAGNVLKNQYGIMDQQSIVDKLGSRKNAAKVCKENCLADLGRKLNADYIAQGQVGRFGENYTIEVKLYNSASGLQAAIFTGNSRDLSGLLDILNEKAPDMFGKIMPKKQSATTKDGLHGNELTDSRDGKKYRVVKIGNQTWMAENLNYDADGSRCYENSEYNCAKYGRLYEWDAAMKACPSGWHLPSKAEWNSLTQAAGGSKFAGRNLKAKDSNGKDTHGFSAFLGGVGTPGDVFSHISLAGYWWSSNISWIWLGNYAYYQRIYSQYEFVLWDSNDKRYMFSVRCLQDKRSVLQ